MPTDLPDAAGATDVPGYRPVSVLAVFAGHRDVVQWLFTVCRNCALKSLKKEDRYIYIETQEFEQKRCEKMTPSAELEHKERIERVMELVQRLPKNRHEVVRLRFHGHHSYQEISEITGLGVGNVGFLLNAAMRSLRGMMERDDKEEKIIYLKKGAV